MYKNKFERDMKCVNGVKSIIERQKKIAVNCNCGFKLTQSDKFKDI